MYDAGVTETGEKSGTVASSAAIDVREAYLRVLAASAATIIAGWTVYAAGHLGSASGWRLIFWAAGFAWSALWGASPGARALGRRKKRRYWILAGGYACYLPFISWVSAGSGPSPTGKKPLIELADGGSLALVIASMAVLIALAIGGFLLERSSLSVQHQPRP